MRALIERYRLWDNDTVYAYDLAWEPMFGDHEGRKRWDPEWREWIIERYGSIENAETDWEFQAPREPGGQITNPLDPHVVENGPHWRMVAAYRRFLDTILYKYYDRARRLVRTVDPNHLVSFRMTLAGDPTVRWSKTVPYDYACLAGAVDLLEPEAYGRIGDWERVKPGWFTYEYGRWANPDLPLLWAEAGVSAWSQALMAAPREQLDFQAAFYTDMYRMMLGSGADGIYWWWYPGGYRTNERSDYGIINPDGTDRPVTKVIREHAETFLNAPSAKPVDHWITIDRDPIPTASRDLRGGEGRVLGRHRTGQDPRSPHRRYRHHLRGLPPHGGRQRGVQRKQSAQVPRWLLQPRRDPQRRRRMAGRAGRRRGGGRRGEARGGAADRHEPGRGRVAAAGGGP